jgi:hypothetical protein
VTEACKGLSAIRQGSFRCFDPTHTLRTRGSKGPGRKRPGPSETLILPWQQDRSRRAIRLGYHPHAGAANIVDTEEPSAFP